MWIDEAEAKAIHERLLATHGGASGLRDPGLLASALARPRQIEAYRDAPDAVELAAAYTAGVVRNHPFADGNKRTGFVLGILFLELNGARFTASEAEATQAVLDLASGALDHAGYAAFLRGNIEVG
ncbi:MAG TPA: type II toxin-antitoxin system death-on-curing family toxin [Caulobacteraceae bacterium]